MPLSPVSVTRTDAARLVVGLTLGLLFLVEVAAIAVWWRFVG